VARSRLPNCWNFRIRSNFGQNVAFAYFPQFRIFSAGGGRFIEFDREIKSWTPVTYDAILELDSPFCRVIGGNFEHGIVEPLEICRDDRLVRIVWAGNVARWNDLGRAEDLLLLIVKEDGRAQRLQYRALGTYAHEMRFVGWRGGCEWHVNMAPLDRSNRLLRGSRPLWKVR
jgi:hypothetical protein